MRKTEKEKYFSGRYYRLKFNLKKRDIMSGSYEEKGLRKQRRKRCKRKFEKDKDKETMSGRWIKAVRKRKKRYNVWNEDTRFRKKEEEKDIMSGRWIKD